MKNYEQDKFQCQVIKKDGKRCTQIARHSNGGKLLCPRHQSEMIKSKVKQK